MKEVVLQPEVGQTTNQYPRTQTLEKQPLTSIQIPPLVKDAVEGFTNAGFAVFGGNKELRSRWLNFVKENMPEASYMMAHKVNSAITYLDYREKGDEMVVEAILCYGLPGCRVGEMTGEVQVELTLQQREWKGSPMMPQVTGFKILKHKNLAQ